jgi:prepilin-type processing-associated H-X9-DG protein
VDFTVDPRLADPKVLGHEIAFYTCPSDGRALTRLGGLLFPHHVAATNYVGNAGSGVQKAGYNGFFRPIHSPYPQYSGGFLSSSEMSDGLSNTAAFSEILVGDGSQHRLRTNYNTANMRNAPDELEAFAADCRSGDYAPLGEYWFRGRPWLDGNLSRTLYNHVLTPNLPSCANGTDVQRGAYTAASNHSGGVLVAFGDGHVEFVGDAVALQVWRAMASRNGTE